MGILVKYFFILVGF